MSDEEEVSGGHRKTLFEDDTEGEGVPTTLENLNVDQDYATRLLRRKREEELRIMRRKFGDDGDAEDGDKSPGDTSDDEGFMLSDKKKLEIASIIKVLRSGDMSQLQKDRYFYESESGSSTDGGYVTDPQGKHKYTIKSQIWDAIEGEDDLTKLGELAKLYEEQADGVLADAPAAERQRKREEFLSAVAEADAGTDAWEIKERQQNAEEMGEGQERDEKFWATREGKALLRDIDRRTRAKQEMEALFTNADKDPKENFLKNFFANDGWSWSKATEEEQAREMKKEKKAKSTTEPNQPTAEDALDTSAEEEFTNNQEIFEHTYEEFKYRHQEPGFDNVAVPPTGPSLRRKESTRKRRRLIEKERERKRKQAFEDELGRMRELKKEKLSRKKDWLATVKSATEDEFPAELLERIRDAPMEEYDKLMAEVFNESYYETKEKGFRPEKEEWDEQGEIKKIFGSNIPQDKRQLIASVFSEPEVPARASRDGPAESGSDSEDQKRTISKKTLQRELEQEIKYTQEELDGLGYEDVIAGGKIKTRFKYHNIEPIRFDGLDETDILVLPDATLEAIAPTRYLAVHQSPEEYAHHKRMVEQRLLRMGDWDYQKIRKSKKFRSDNGIDPATWDEVREKLEQLKAEKGTKRAQKLATVAVDDDDDDERRAAEERSARKRKKAEKGDGEVKQKRKKSARAEAEEPEV